MNDLLEARHDRRQRELREMGTVMAVAFGDPEKLETMFPEGPKVEITDEQMEKWWEVNDA